VIAVNAAVAAESGTSKLYLRPSPLQTSLLKDHPIGADGHETPAIEEVETPTVAIDEIIDMAGGHVDFLKMDIEGAEGDVLRAASDRRWLGTRWLIEVHDTRAGVGDFFTRIGFQNLRVQRHPYPDAHPQHFWVYVEDGLDEER